MPHKSTSSVAGIEIEQQRLARLSELTADDVSIERTFNDINVERLHGRLAESALEAIAYALREHGSEALQHGRTRDRIAELSNSQLESVITRMSRMRGQYPKLTEDLLLALAELLP